MQAVVIKGGALWDGRSDALAHGWGVVVEGPRIATVGPLSGLDLGSSARVIDLGTDTLIPGMINAHVHLWADPAERVGEPEHAIEGEQAVLRMAKHAFELLRSGFTTVRDCGAPGRLAVILRNAIEADIVPGPRVLVAGRPICITGGHGFRFGREADGPQEVVKAVRENVRDGVDFIKVMATAGVWEGCMPEYGYVELRALVREAKRTGRRVAAHAHAPEGIRRAVTAGVDTIEHGSSKTGNGWDVRPEVLEAIAERGTYVIPTPVSYRIAERRGDQEVMEEWHHSWRSLVNAGVSLVAGTDAGVTGMAFNESAYAVEVLARVGLSPRRALRAATSTAAEALGLGAEVGRLASGFRADLVAVKGDPLADPSTLRRVTWVMKDGKSLPGEGVR